MTTSAAAVTATTTVTSSHEQLRRNEKRKNLAMITIIASCTLCPLVIGGTMWFEGMRNNQEGLTTAGMVIVIISAAFDTMVALFLVTVKCAFSAGVGH